MADNRNNTRIALSRSRLYAFLTEAFIRLPEGDFILTLKSQEILDFLNHYKNVDQKEMAQGINTILAFIEKLKRKPSLMWQRRWLSIGLPSFVPQGKAD